MREIFQTSCPLIYRKRDEKQNLDKKSNEVFCYSSAPGDLIKQLINFQIEIYAMKCLS